LRVLIVINSCSMPVALSFRNYTSSFVSDPRFSRNVIYTCFNELLIRIRIDSAVVLLTTGRDVPRFLTPNRIEWNFIFSFESESNQIDKILPKSNEIELNQIKSNRR